MDVINIEKHARRDYFLLSVLFLCADLKEEVRKYEILMRILSHTGRGFYEQREI